MAECTYGMKYDLIRKKALSLMSGSGEKEYLYPQIYPDFLKNVSIRSRIPRLEEKTSQTVINMVKAVSTLERWWWLKYNELRRLETMPAENLNDYLKEFFTVLVKPDGENYIPDHLVKARSYLERFLRENGYLFSLSKSSEFRSSQQAIRIKRQSIQVKRAQETGEDRILQWELQQQQTGPS